MGQQLIQLPGVDSFITVSGFVLGLPGQMPYVLTLVVHMIKVPAKQLWVTI